MSGSDFLNPVPSSGVGGIRSNQPSTPQSAERQQKLNDLQDKIRSGSYRVDLQKLAAGIQHSGVLSDE